MAGERLSKYDAIFYFTSNRRVAMQVTVGMFVDGPVDFKRYLEWVIPRIHRMPALRQVLKPAPFHVQRPKWTPSQRFDVTSHVFSHNLAPPGDDASLRTCFTELMHRRLPADKPLWQLHVINGLENNRAALLLITHHCMADAEGILEIFDVLLEAKGNEAAPNPSNVARERQANRPRRSDTINHTLSRATRRRFQELFRYARARTPQFPFARPTTGNLNIAWHQIPLEPIRAIGRALGVTATDVFLSTLGAAMDSYAARLGIAVDDTNLLVQVPANVRAPDRYGQLGNELAMLPCIVPLGIENPVDRLQRVAEYNRNLKTLDVAAILHRTMGRALAVATPPGQALICRTMVSKPFLHAARLIGLPPREHALLSSIVVPSLNYAIDGQPLTEFINLIQCQFNMGLVLSPVTYNGNVTLAISVDAKNVGEPAPILNDIVSAIDGLHERAQDV